MCRNSIQRIKGEREEAFKSVRGENLRKGRIKDVKIRTFIIITQALKSEPKIGMGEYIIIVSHCNNKANSARTRMAAVEWRKG